MDLRYYSSAGKKTNRTVCMAALVAGMHVSVELATAQMQIAKEDGHYISSCKEHCAKCKMLTPERAMQWVEDHLKQHHS